MLQSKWIYNEHTPYIPFPVEHKLKTLHDVKSLKYLCENIGYEPCYDVFEKTDAGIGEDGLATATAPGQMDGIVDIAPKPTGDIHCGKQKDVGTRFIRYGLQPASFLPHHDGMIQ